MLLHLEVNLISLENYFQRNLIKELKTLFPGCVVLKNDSSYKPGIPDLLILFEDKWAVLECKKEKGARQRPNQGYYVDQWNEMSFAAFIYPENKEEVLYDLQQTFRPRRSTRVSKR